MTSSTKRRSPAASTLAVAVALTLTACGPELQGTLDLDIGTGALGIEKFQRAEHPVPGHYLVTLSKDARGDVRELAAGLARGHGAEITFVYEAALRGFAARMPEQAALALARSPQVELVEEDGVVTADAIQVNPPWGLDRIDSRALQQNARYVYGDTGAGVHAYIIDTGIRRTHAELSGRMGNGYDAVTAGGTADDCHGHGTHVAGTVGGTTYGVAKGVTLHPVRVLDCGGSGSYAGVVAGINWVAANHLGPAVANMSLGGSASSTVDSAVQGLIDSGVTTVVAAGNSNADACNHSPARAPNALTVGATTSSDARASYSNWGGCLDLFAPGDGILSAYNSGDTATATLSGTSMASPHVAGAVALYLQDNPGASPDQVAGLIRNAAGLGYVGNEGTSSPDRLLSIAFNSYSLRAGTGHYVVAEGSGGGDVFANRTAVGAWEKWNLVDLNGGALSSGDFIYLQAYNGDYLVALNGGGADTGAIWNIPDTWETFRIIRLAGPGQINSGDQIALQSYYGHYVVAEGNGGGDVNANRVAIGPWETFQLDVQGW
ncbi:MAG TPA: S8 family serine peptidase [Myxococcales bacterium]|nr:S8 family serine peptidase [Myxococcales bacterium]